MKKIIFLGVLIFNLSLISNAQYVKIKMSNLNIVIGKDTIKGNDGFILLKNNSNKEESLLFSNSNLEIKATYKVNTNNVRRSNLRKSAVDVNINYTFYYNSKKQKVKTERIFYLADDMKFNEQQRAIFKEGIKNKIINISYDCVLE
jgi:hypothetical protein